MSHHHSTAKKRQTQEAGVMYLFSRAQGCKMLNKLHQQCQLSLIISATFTGDHLICRLGISINKGKNSSHHFIQSKKNPVVLPFVQDYTSYQNHILLCKRSPKERTHIVITKYNMSESKGCCAMYVWVISQVTITHNPTKGYWHEIRLNSFNYHSILVTYTGWLLQVIPLEDL